MKNLIKHIPIALLLISTKALSFGMISEPGPDNTAALFIKEHTPQINHQDNLRSLVKNIDSQEIQLINKNFKSYNYKSEEMLKNREMTILNEQEKFISKHNLESISIDTLTEEEKSEMLALVINEAREIFEISYNQEIEDQKTKNKMRLNALNSLFHESSSAGLSVRKQPIVEFTKFQENGHKELENLQSQLLKSFGTTIDYVLSLDLTKLTTDEDKEAFMQESMMPMIGKIMIISFQIQSYTAIEQLIENKAEETALKIFL